MILVLKKAQHSRLKSDVSNRPLHTCFLGCLAFEKKWGWRWPCFDRVSHLFYVNDAVLMLISRNLQKNAREVVIETRSPPASFSFKGQATKHTTVKWSNHEVLLQFPSIANPFVFVTYSLKTHYESVSPPWKCFKTRPQLCKVQTAITNHYLLDNSTGFDNTLISTE